MKNVYLLATDKPSRLIHNDANQLCYQSNKSFKNDRKWMYRKKFNIYITNDEEIKMDDWYLDDTNSVRQAITECESYWTHRKKYQKIILTTDTDLIKDGVQVIDDEFLEWFIKNPSCEYVEVKTRYVHYYKTGETFISLSKTPEFSSRNMQCIKIEPRYEIIIPKEEPKQETHICKYCKAETSQSDDECYAKPKQETLEEAAERFWLNDDSMTDYVQRAYITGFIQGAKSDAAKNYWFKIFRKEFITWMQERMYSEEEVESLLHKYMQSQIPDWHGWSTTKWFEQFKKK